MNKLKEIKLLFRLAWEVCPYLYFSTLVSSMLSTAQTLTYIFMPKFILDALIAHDDWKHVLLLIGIFIGVIALIKMIDLLTKSWRNVCTNRAGIDIVNHYMSYASRTLFAAFERSDYRNKLDTAMSKVRGNAAIDFCVQTFSSIFGLVIYSAFIASINPLLLVIILIAVISNTVANVRLNRLEEETLPDYRFNARSLNYINQTFSSFENAKEMRLNNVEGLIEKKYNENIESRWKLDTYYTKKQFFINLAHNLICSVETVLLYGYAAYMVASGTLSLGSFSAYIASANGISNAFSTMINAWLQFNLTLKFVPLYREIKELSQEHENTESLNELPLQPEIRFENVTFKYPNTQNNVLEDINLTLSPGCKLAVVGENGAGKTTFIKLLCRLYHPTSGRITVNGIDINTISSETYAKLLSVVFQDYKLFSFDVADNIVMNSELHQERLNDVIEMADLKNKLQSLELGEKTFVNKEFDSSGVEFSGGESQKLVLARAYYKNSPIVVLDEPTAALDPLAEQYLYRHFRSIIGEHSAIFISHRLASTSFCDRIAVFSNGKIVEQGTHSDLLKNGGIYSDMWNLQVELYAGKGSENNE